MSAWPNSKQRIVDVLREDEKQDHHMLTREERLELLRPYLPPVREPRDGARTAPGSSAASTANGPSRSHLGLRRFLRNQVDLLVFNLMHAFFSLYMQLRQAWHAVVDRVYSILYYHHRSPELIARDLRRLSRLPSHLSVILTLEGDGRRSAAALERLVNEAAEIAAWCASAGIPQLSIYEKTGILKGYMANTHRVMSRKLAAYFGRNFPDLTLGAPHMPSIETFQGSGRDSSTGSNSSSTRRPSTNRRGASDTDDRDTNNTEDDDASVTPPPVPLPERRLSVLLLSAEDGRDSLVDLTKTLAEMVQRSKVSPADVTMDLVDAELTESVMGEPELLILFGPVVDLEGYPPWQVRLTEIFHVQDNHGVGYQVFCRALRQYAKAQRRRGR